jgi:hypothetical protein
MLKNKIIDNYANATAEAPNLPATAEFMKNAADNSPSR